MVYAVGGNALAPPDGSENEEHALVLAKVMSDVVDLLEVAVEARKSGELEHRVIRLCFDLATPVPGRGEPPVDA